MVPKRGVQFKSMQIVEAEVMDRDLHKEAKGWVTYISQQEDSFFGHHEKISNPQLRALCEEFSSLFYEFQVYPQEEQLIIKSNYCQAQNSKPETLPAPVGAKECN